MRSFLLCLCLICDNNFTMQKKMQVAGPRRIELPRVMSEGINTEGSTKLYISNLDYDVTNRDIEVLFLT